jgi:hypothetical protein
VYEKRQSDSIDLVKKFTSLSSQKSTIPSLSNCHPFQFLLLKVSTTLSFPTRMVQLTKQDSAYCSVTLYDVMARWGAPSTQQNLLDILEQALEIVSDNELVGNEQHQCSVDGRRSLSTSFRQDDSATNNNGDSSSTGDGNDSFNCRRQ